MTVKIPTGRSYKAAREYLRNPEFIATPRWTDQKSRADRRGAQSDILDFERSLIAKLKSIGIPMFAHCVMRDPVEQNRLLRDGFSKAGAGQSPHQYGYAVDIIHSTLPWDIHLEDHEFARKCWALIGELGKEVSQTIGVPVDWGGDWKFYDPAHWELKDWENSLIS